MAAAGIQFVPHVPSAALPPPRARDATPHVAANADLLAIATTRSGDASPRRLDGDGLVRSDIEASLAAVLASETFSHSQRHRAFLAYVVGAVLDGRRRSLKEVVIGLDVFARQINGYDPDRDSIVRVEARRLRAKLQRYYAGEGAGDRVRIALPIGGYVPVFDRCEPVAPESADPLLLVLPFVAVNDDAREAALATTLADQLMDRLAAAAGTRVMSPTADCGLRARRIAIETLREAHGIDYVVDGSITRHGTRFRCVSHVSRTADGVRVWSGRFEHDAASPDDDDPFAFQDRVVAETCRAVLGERATASH